MGKPWEKYQQQKADGPWTKYQQQSKPAVGDYMEKLSPEQEMPEWISAKERAIAKNFGNTPVDMMNYLKQQHPDKEFSIGPNEQVLARDKGGKWKVLDPDTGFFSKDILHDAADIAYDVPSGMVQAAGTALGAAAGGATMGPAGILPGAAAGSGTSGAATEYARQKIGQALGIPQKVDTGRVVVSGATGVATPFLFGAGKPTQAVINQLMKNGMSEEAANVAASQSGRGLLERGYDALPTVQSWATGVNKDAIDYAKNNMDEVRKLKLEGITPSAESASSKVQNYFDKQLEDKGKAVTTAMQNAGEQVESFPAKSAFLSRIGQLEAKADITNAEKAELESLKSYYNKYFGLATPKTEMVQDAQQILSPKEVVTKTEIPNFIDAPRAFDLQQKLKKAAAFETNMTPETASAKGSARNAYGALNDALIAPTNGESQAAKDAYAKLIQQEKEIAPKFADNQKTVNTVLGLDKRGKAILKEQLQGLENSGKLNIADDIDKINAYDQFYGTRDRRSGLSYGLGALGGLLGWKAGPWGSAAGSGIGMWAGHQASKPEVLLKALSLQNKLEGAGRYLQPPGGAGRYLAPAAAQEIPWALMPTKPSE